MTCTHPMIHTQPDRRDSFYQIIDRSVYFKSNSTRQNKNKMNTQKVWLVTGASKGFGFEIVKSALAKGDKVVATVRTKPEQLVTAFHNNPDLLEVLLDVTNEGQAKLASQQAIDHFGRNDVLVNNAGYGLLS